VFRSPGSVAAIGVISVISGRKKNKPERFFRRMKAYRVINMYYGKLDVMFTACI
jgi:hypothetical protein